MTQPTPTGDMRGEPGDVPAPPAGPPTVGPASQGPAAPPSPPAAPPRSTAPQSPQPSSAAPQSPQPSAAAETTVIAAQPAQPEKRRRPDRRGLLVAVIAVTVVLSLVIVGAVIHTVLNRSVYGPDATANKFVEALNTGDFDKARAYANFTVPEGAYTDLLDDPKYAQSAASKLGDAKLVESHRDGDTATFTVSYQLGEESKTMRLTAHRVGRQGLFFDKWQIDAPALGTVKISAPTEGTVKVNGQDFRPSNAGTSYAVLPGSYELSVPGSKYLQAAASKAAVGFGDEGAQAVTLSAYPKAAPALQADVQKLVNDRISSCAKKKELKPAGCQPFFISGSSGGKTVEKDLVRKSIKWKLKLPQINAQLSAQTPTKAFFTTKKAGSASLTADSKTAGKKAWKLIRPMPLKPSGEIRIDGDKLTLKTVYNW